MVRAEATTGLMLAGGFATLVVAFLLCVLGVNAPLWADRTRVATVICIYTVPLLMAVTAIVSGRRMDGLSGVAGASRVGPRHPAMVVGMAGSVWAVGIGLAQAIVPLVLIPPTDPLPPTALLSWAQAMASLVAGAWAGACGGVWLRGRLAGPFLALGAFGWFYFSLSLPGRWRLAAPFDSPWYVPWIQPSAGAPLGHALVAAALVLAVLAILTAHVRNARVVGMLAAGCAALGVFAVISVEEPLRYEPRPMPDGPMCAPIGTDSVFCAHPLAGATAQETAHALGDVRRIVGDLWAIPSRMVPYDYPAETGDVAVPMSYGGDRETHLANAAFALSPSCEESARGQESWDNVLFWLLGQLGLWTPASDSSLAPVFELDRDEQRLWVREQLKAGSCS